MSNGQIKSSTVAASGAISELVGIEATKLQDRQVVFRYIREIPGMTTAQKTANSLLQVMGEFSAAIVTQAKKCPELAQKIEQRDIADAKRWEK